MNSVLSFRSTEFIDDYARDNLATNSFEIKETGWAWGQIADMEAWYAQLTGPGGALNGNKFSVTGYSLGGHLATAFNLLHPGAADKVVTFNGAGVGRIKGATGDDLGPGLAHALGWFNSLRANTGAIADTFFAPAMGSLYRTVSAGLADGSMTLAEARAALTAYPLPAPSAPDAATIYKDNARFSDALDQIQAIANDVARLTTIHAGGDFGNAAATPKLVPMSQIAAANLDYRMAVLLTSLLSEATPLAPDGAMQTIHGRVYEDPKLDNQFDVIGDTQPSAVSNSQWHHGHNVPVFIEDQPLYRGGVGLSAGWTSFLNSGVKLLVDQYAIKDFGDTHSLALLVDSLSAQDALLGLVQPDLKAGATEDLSGILRAASNLKRVDGALAVGGDQGKAEGDVLENVVNALGYMLLGASAGKTLKGSPDGNTWARFDDDFPANTNGYTGRDSFFAKLDTIRKNPNYQALTDKLNLVSLAGRDISSSAKTDFGDFVALEALSPFALRPLESDSSAEAALDAVWQGVHATNFIAWTADRNARLQGDPAKDFDFSDTWYSDRASMLSYSLVRNQRNDEVAIDWRRPKSTDYSDLASGNKVLVVGADGGTIPEQNRDRVVFATSADETIAGGDRVDHIYGGDGADTLTGGLGDDYLEGNAGVDRLDGGAGRDTLRGGDGDDNLSGAGEDDQLYGGKDKDVLDGGGGRDRLDGGAGSDILRGGTEDDVLHGGAGDDEFNGGTGDDVLQDDSGYDSYVLATGDGADTIDDTDGLGEIEVNATKLTGGTATYAGLWKQTVNGKDVWYGFSPGADGRGDLLIQSEVGQTTVKHFKSGDLGIVLGDPVPDVIAYPTTTNTVAGSAFDDNRIGTGGPPIFGGPANDRVQGLAGRDEALGKSGNDIVEGGAGIDVVAGNSGNDTLFADVQLTPAALRDYISTSATAPTVGAAPSKLLVASSEWLEGGLGNDTVVGSDSNDILFGGGGSDVLVGGAGHDLINGDDDFEPGDLTAVYVQPGVGSGAPFNAWYSSVYVHDFALDVGAADEIHAGSGDDAVYGEVGDDTVWGDDGNDTMSGGEDDDVMFGGNGNDRLTGDDYGELIGSTATTPIGNDFIDGGAGNDQIYGDGGADTLLGGAGNDSIHGNNDIVEDGASPTAADDKDDYIAGGDGNDHLVGDAADDTILGGAGNDVMFGDSDATPVAYQGNDYLDGGDGNDYLRGYGGDDILLGGDGDDEILGEDGNDTIDLGPDTDAVNRTESASGGEGDDTITSPLGAYSIITGDAGDDVVSGTGYLSGGDGDDALTALGMYGQPIPQQSVLQGGAGNDLLSAPNGGASLYGDEGNDTLQGGLGLSFLSAGVGDDLILGGSGIDYAWGEAGDDTLSAGGGNDQIAGGAGKDVLYGDDGNDAVLGDDGNDTLNGGTGNNYLDGGAGDDTYIREDTGGDDFIVDTGGTNVLQFAEGIDPSQLTYRSGDDAQGNSAYLIIEGFPSGGSVTIAGGLSGTVSRFEFADGTSLTSEAVHDLALAPRSQPAKQVPVTLVTLKGSSGDDTISATAATQTTSAGFGNDVIVGGSADDQLWGDAGNDRLVGGGGKNRLVGGDGLDTYVVGLTDGGTVIAENHVTASAQNEQDTIEFGIGVLPQQTRLIKDGSNLVVAMNNGAAQVVVEGYFATTMPTTGGTVYTDRKIETMRFADGTVWNSAQIAAAYRSRHAERDGRHRCGQHVHRRQRSRHRCGASQRRHRYDPELGQLRLAGECRTVGPYGRARCQRMGQRRQSGELSLRQRRE